MMHKKKSDKNSYLFAYLAAFVAAIGGFLLSSTTCSIAGALFFILEEFHLTPLQEGNIVSIILLGALLGALFSGYLSDRVGRKSFLFFSALLYLLSAIFIHSVNSLSQLFLLRFVSGAAVGISSVVVPLYLAEIAPAEKRGAFVATFQLAITLGTLGAYLSNAFYSDAGNWRLMFFISAIPSFLQFFALFFLPESPKWLLSKGKTEKGLKILKSLGESLPKQSQKTPQKKKKERLISGSTLRKTFIIGMLLCILQQFCGINAIVYFAPKIFQEAGFVKTKSILPMLTIAMVNVISTFLSVFLIDRLGRRKLLLASTLGLIFSLLICFFAFFSKACFSEHLSLLALMIYIFSYSIGMGPITWVLISELYPISVRAKIIALMTFVSWLSNYIVILSFPYFSANIGLASTFGLYAVVTMFAFFFFYFYIPETKEKSLEELSEKL